MGLQAKPALGTLEPRSQWSPCITTLQASYASRLSLAELAALAELAEFARFYPAGRRNGKRGGVSSREALLERCQGPRRLPTARHTSRSTVAQPSSACRRLRAWCGGPGVNASPTRAGREARTERVGKKTKRNPPLILASCPRKTRPRCRRIARSFMLKAGVPVKWGLRTHIVLVGMPRRDGSWHGIPEPPRPRTSAMSGNASPKTTKLSKCRNMPVLTAACRPPPRRANMLLRAKSSSWVPGEWKFLTPPRRPRMPLNAKVATHGEYMSFAAGRYRVACACTAPGVCGLHMRLPCGDHITMLRSTSPAFARSLPTVSVGCRNGPRSPPLRGPSVKCPLSNRFPHGLPPTRLWRKGWASPARAPMIISRLSHSAKFR